MRRNFPTVVLLCALAVESIAQSVTFPDDAIERGYFDRPYLRYEAEMDKCTTDGVLLPPSFTQTDLQSEASNQSATQLIASGSYVQWTNSEAGRGLTVRFSLPDNNAGVGMKGTLALYVNGVFRQHITLDSYWAWQYFLRTMSNPYPDNTPDSATKFPRMRFDETHLLLDSEIPAGAVFKLVKADDNNTPYTIDFVELEPVPEPVTFESIPDVNKVAYSGEGSLSLFISQHAGKTIYIPAGRHESEYRLSISGNDTKLIGAGMWYTEIYFSASSDEKSTHNRRGIETYSSNIVIDGLFLNTVNNKRYYDSNSSYQVGKGLMGSFGSNSVIRNVWAEHFECGAWIDGTTNLLVVGCRFRNNYADGINLSYGSANSVVEHCSFRNNGDDDMATWSRSDRSCDNNTFRYSVSENNWRASSLGFFGGKQNKAHNCLIIDPMEAGFRITCDFSGKEFSADGYSEFYNISVYKGGTASGTRGQSGDLWGNRQGAVHINSSSQYDLQNIKIYNVDLYDSKEDAIFIGSASRFIRNLILNDIRIHGTGRYGLFFSGAKGDGSYCGIEYENIGAETNTNAVSSSFSFTEQCTSDIQSTEKQKFSVSADGSTLIVSGINNSSVSVYDLLGQQNIHTETVSGEAVIHGISSGIYLVRANQQNETVKIVAP
ncbi:MAG: right-handed parallel beta-helix repeat-containing protein [Bacteroidales bacterium]|nr:right-handed parallel beta-helix repeat-containing protein [Bacteroidales bacterium]